MEVILIFLANNLTVDVSGTDHTLTLQSDTIIDQNLSKNTAPTFNGINLTGAIDYNSSKNVSLQDNNLQASTFLFFE